MATRYNTPYDYLIYLLSRKEYSAAELLQKLKLKGYDLEESLQALHQCQEKKYQSDVRFAESYIHDQALAGFGLNTIKMKLKQKGVKEEDIETALEQAPFPIDWFAQAFTYYIRKGFHLENSKEPKIKAKILRNMLSKGYNFEQINQVQATLVELAELEYDLDTFILDGCKFQEV